MSTEASLKEPSPIGAAPLTELRGMGKEVWKGVDPLNPDAPLTTREPRQGVPLPYPPTLEDEIREAEQRVLAAAKEWRLSVRITPSGKDDAPRSGDSVRSLRYAIDVLIGLDGGQ